MSAFCIVISAICTMLSAVGLMWWAFPIWKDFGFFVDSKIAIFFLLAFAVNLYILLALALKTLFFKQISPSEYEKVLEQHIDYVLYKGTLLPLVVPPNIIQMVLWTIWLVVLCSFKIFQSLCNDQLERLYTSPTVTSSKYLTVFIALLLVLTADLFWLRLCLVAYTFFGSSLFLLSFFEPFSIAFETLLALIVHGYNLVEIWQRPSIDTGTYCLGSHDIYKSIEAAGSLAESKGTFNRNCGFLLGLLASSMSVGHYLMIWWLQGMEFHLVNIVIFVYFWNVLATMVKRVKGFIKVKNAPISLVEAFPDATKKELSAFDDQCVICRGPMTKAKKLPCNHLFHLVCLRSWLDQGWTELYCCPTCRRPVFGPSSQNQTNSFPLQVSNDVHIAESINFS